MTMSVKRDLKNLYCDLLDLLGVMLILGFLESTMNRKLYAIIISTLILGIVAFLGRNKITRIIKKQK